MFSIFLFFTLNIGSNALASISALIPLFTYVSNVSSMWSKILVDILIVSSLLKPSFFKNILNSF
ncbi:MAG: hypothetical protein SPLM_01040 [Spiroplasma phoeniceum]|uniref:Uncharacterized protein n=1 Tax=Spiroplasma phoeniceum P40 TaxID=1276259 RepID=A0A345DMV3_9MOLU|nr:hypothetical protein SDAV_00547 [Spiroplasma phoeniceum P40]